MTADYDLVIRNGTLADGSGGELQQADIGIKDGRIAAIGAISGRGGDGLRAGADLGRVRGCPRALPADGDHRVLGQAADRLAEHLYLS